jgi:hypothetical protein
MFFVPSPSFAAEGVVSKDVMHVVVVAADAWGVGVGGVYRESEFVDLWRMHRRKGEWCEAILHRASGHCNKGVGCGRREDA